VPFFSIPFPCLFFGIHVAIVFCCKRGLLSRAMTILSFYLCSIFCCVCEYRDHWNKSRY
jgi:hypothetical protein